MAIDNRPYVANLDFDEIKADIINYFQNREEFKDYNFTGSSLNMLIDILAYNTHYQALASNFLVNEMFMDSALLRSNVVSIAKQLNYTPRSARSAMVGITVNVPRLDQENFILIPAGSKFISSASSITANTSYTFHTVEDYVVQFEPSDTSKNIKLLAYEGQLATTRHVATARTIEDNRFLIDAEGLDESTLKVRVNNLAYTRVTPEKEGSLNLSRDSYSFWLEENRLRTYDLVFGTGVVGKALEVGDIILASYLISSGSAANGISKFYANINGRPDIRVVTVDGKSQGGAEIEKISEIKDSAPHWYQSQYRAVTVSDYESIIRKNYADLQSVNVYGGEEIGRPGFVFIAIKPRSADALTDSAKTVIQSAIIKANNVVTVRPQIIDPLVVKLVLKTVAIYDSTKTAFGADILQSRIQSAYEIINQTYVGDFLKHFRESSLSYELRGISDAIESTNTRVRLRVDQTVKDSKLQFNSWSYGNKLYHPQDGFGEATGGVVFTNDFTRNGGQATSGFDDDGSGNLRLYDIVLNQKSYVNIQAGTINYETGEVEILTDFGPDDNQSITFTAIPDSVDVQAERNTILQVATDASSVSMIEKGSTSLIKENNLTRSI